MIKTDEEYSWEAFLIGVILTKLKFNCKKLFQSPVNYFPVV